MGALTDNRKRCFIDLYLPFSPHPISNLSLAIPPSKKPKIQSPPSTPDHTTVSFPPAAPLPRPVHAPQRIVKAFGLGSSRRRTLLKEEFTEMGNFVSRFFRSKKEEKGNEGLGLEKYKKLVADSDSRKVGVGLSDLAELTKGEEETELKVLNRKVEDARKVVQESVAVREEKVWGKEGPIYKKLYEETKKHDSRLSSLAFELKLAEEKISAFRIASKVEGEKPEEDLHELFQPLTDEEEYEVSYALHGGNSREVLITHEPSNIEITREVLQCLDCGAWLNDEVINLYLELLKERERREPKRFLKCHFFNSFFYKKLISGRNGYDFKAVRRWTTQKKLGYSLIECDKIFVPIHKDIHWCLAVINVKDETFQYLDSLGDMDTAMLRILARYFMDEVKDKSDKQIDTASWKLEVIDNLPLQKNGWDCGMFMLKYTDFYSRGLGLCFSQEHMAYFRKRTAKEILRLRAE